MSYVYGTLLVVVAGSFVGSLMADSWVIFLAASLLSVFVLLLHFIYRFGEALGWWWTTEKAEEKEYQRVYGIEDRAERITSDIHTASGGIRYNVRREESKATHTSYGHLKPGRLLHPTPENFEEYCAEWCRYLSYQDAVKTQNSRDGGIDIRASNMIAQVKFQANPVGVGPIRELNGVKRGSQETLFFALNGYTPEARREASEIGMTLITVRPVEGTIDITA